MLVKITIKADGRRFSKEKQDTLIKFIVDKGLAQNPTINCGGPEHERGDVEGDYVDYSDGHYYLRLVQDLQKTHYCRAVIQTTG
jgi:hypothetical protein